MRGRRTWARVVTGALVAAPLAVVATSAPAGAATESETYFSYTSTAGDWVGQGASGTVTPPSQFTMSGTHGALSLRITAPTETWTVDLAAPRGQQLSTGTYESALRAPFNEAAPGLSVSVTGRGCNTVKGRFVVNALTADSRGRITSLDATLTQFCDGGAGRLDATVKYAAPYVIPPVLTSSTPRTVAGQDVTLTARVAPGTGAGGVVFYDGTTPIGQASFDAAHLARLTVPTLAVGTHSLYARVGTAQSARLLHEVAASETSFWFRSENGDSIGRGATASHLPTDSQLGVSGTTSAATLTVEGLGSTEYWRAEFAAPLGETLHPGRSYAGAVRSMSRTATSPGLDVSGNGRGCNALTGDFTVHALTSAPDGTVQSMEISFVQRCETSTARMTGWARFAVRPTPQVSTTVLTHEVTGPLTATLTAVVTGGETTPTGRVVLREGTTTLGSAPLDASARVTVPLTMSRGVHALTAEYTGDGSHDPSAATTSVSLPGFVTTTTLSSAVTGPLGATLTAAVVGAGTAVPRGQVVFSEGTTTLGSATVDASGRATLPMTSTRGTHTVTATYSGSTTDQPSSGTGQVSLPGRATTSAFTAPKTAKIGKPVTVSVTVTGPAGTPTGTVRLYDGVEPVGTTVTLLGGRATISWTPTAKGSRSLTVRYVGDSTFAPSVSPARSVKVS